VIHLLHNEPRVERPLQDEEPSTREMLNRTIALALSAAVERDLDNRRRVNEVLDALRRAGSDAERYLNPAAGYRRVVVHQYRPRVALGGRTGILNFTREQVEKAIATGESDAMAHDCAENGCIL